MVDHFDISELQTLCFELKVDYENLSGFNKLDKCREIINFFHRRGRLEELIEYCSTQRPNVAWKEYGYGNTSSLENRKTNVIPVLFLAADPTDLTRLRLGEELREIQEKLQLAKLRDRFELHQRMSVQPADISQALLDVQPKIVHFSGHGTDHGDLSFEDKSGRTHPIEPSALAALFAQFSGQVECVVLNACYSEIMADSIADCINYVIGMNQAIGDTAAIAFTIGFYQAIGAGRNFEDAYQLGCVQIRLQGIAEHLTPVLVRKNVNDQDDT